MAKRRDGSKVLGKGMAKRTASKVKARKSRNQSALAKARVARRGK